MLLGLPDIMTFDSEIPSEPSQLHRFLLHYSAKLEQGARAGLGQRADQDTIDEVSSKVLDTIAMTIPAKLAEKEWSFANEGKFCAFLYQYARRTAFDIVKRRNRSMQLPETYEVEAPCGKADVTPESLEAARWLQQALARLRETDPQLAEVLLRVYLLRESPQDVAMSLGISLQALNAMVARACARMRGLLGQEGIGDDDL